MEKSETKKELEKWLNDDRYITTKELAKFLTLQLISIQGILSYKIDPIKKFFGKHSPGFFYEKTAALKAMSGWLKPEYRYLLENDKKTSHKQQDMIMQYKEYANNPELVQFSELPDIMGFSREKIKCWIKQNKIVAKYVLNCPPMGKRTFYLRSECESAKLMTEHRQRGKYKKVQKQQESKPMQTPDFIPADTLDIYTLDQLKAKIPGIENHYETFNKSEIPEYQEIARMLRGNQKSVNLWGKMVEGIKKEVGDVGDVKQIEHTNTVKESNVVSLIKNNIKYHGCVISEESQKWLLDNGFLSVSHIKNICEYNRSAFDLFLCNSGVKPIEVFMPEMNQTEHFFYRDNLWKIHPSTKEYYQEFISNWYDANSDQLGPLTTSRAFDYMKNPAFVNNVYMRSFLHEEAVRRGDLIELDAYKGYFQAKKWSNEEIPTAKTQLITKKTETCRLPLDQSNGQLGNNIDKKAITLSVSVDIRYKLRSLSAMLDRGKSDIVSELVDKYYKEQDALGNLKR